jgi:hypothetical protein
MASDPPNSSKASLLEALMYDCWVQMDHLEVGLMTAGVVRGLVMLVTVGTGGTAAFVLGADGEGVAVGAN